MIMKKNNKKLLGQKGFLTIVAIIMIAIIGFMGAVIGSMFFSTAMSSATLFQGTVTLYVASSGLEKTARYLLTPVLANRSTCAAISGNAALTNASFAGTTVPGTFTAQTVNNAGAVGSYPAIAANTTLAVAMLANSTTATVASTAAFAPKGRIMIDRESINYTGKTATTFIGLGRGAGLSLPSSHANGAQISQLQCTIDVNAGLPTLAAAKYQRELEESIQLQEAWAAGVGITTTSQFSRWNQPAEKTWTHSTLGGGTSVATINGVSVTSNGEGWAVGQGINLDYQFYHEVAGVWTRSSVAARCKNLAKNNLFAVSTVSSQEAWAVGGNANNGTNGGSNCNGGNGRDSIIQWNGTTWTTLAPPAIPIDNSFNNVILRAVHVIDTAGTGTGNIGFIVGDRGIIIKYNGSTWTNDPQSKVITALNLYSVYVVSMTEAWASGGIGNNTGIILKWTGTGGGAGTWSIAASGLTRSLRSIYMRDDTGAGIATSGWAVGLAGINYSYDGTTWTAQANTPGNRNLFAVISFASNDIWAAGLGNNTQNLNHWDGTSWAAVASNMTTQINGLSAIEPSRFPFSGWNKILQ
ncbi:MAG: hypothetical protein P4M12_09065 [Gammaproteobacteria bacterium]|nr:hypothetical protein [Gammaproteobacteria bacterium]